MTNLMNILLMTGGAEGGGSMIQQMLPLVLIIVVFYFFMIRPQLKRQKEQKKFRESLKSGDEVITVGGIYGKIVEVKDNIVLLQIDKDVKIKIDKSTVVQDSTQLIGQK